MVTNEVDGTTCMLDVNDSNEPYYYHSDGLDSVVALSDSEGDIVEKYAYDITCRAALNPERGGFFIEPSQNG